MGKRESGSNRVTRQPAILVIWEKDFLDWMGRICFREAFGVSSYRCGCRALCPARAAMADTASSSNLSLVLISCDWVAGIATVMTILPSSDLVTETLSPIWIFHSWSQAPVIVILGSRPSGVLTCAGCDLNFFASEGEIA